MYLTLKELEMKCVAQPEVIRIPLDGMALGSHSLPGILLNRCISECNGDMEAGAQKYNQLVKTAVHIILTDIDKSDEEWQLCPELVLCAGAQLVLDCSPFWKISIEVE